MAFMGFSFKKKGANAPDDEYGEPTGADENEPGEPPAKSQGGPMMQTIKPNKAGQKPIKFRAGGLHASVGAKPGAKLTAAQHAEAASGADGPKAKKQENFFKNVLKGGGKKKGFKPKAGY